MKSIKISLLTCTVLINMLCLLASCRKTNYINNPETIDRAKDSTADVIEPTSVSQWHTDSGEVILSENLSWIFPWYNSLEIPDFYKKVPTAVPFKVYIKRKNNSEWIEVPLSVDNSDVGIKYEYFIETRPDGAGMYKPGSLYIFYYGSDVNDNPSVKIIY